LEQGRIYKDGYEALDEEFDLARTLIEAGRQQVCRSRSWLGA
jgi:hypothetical protein